MILRRSGGYQPGTLIRKHHHMKLKQCFRCDRILFTKCSRIQAINYRRYETNISDHKPISAGFRVTIKAVNSGRMTTVRGEIGAEWAKKEAAMMDAMVQAYGALL